MQVAGWQVGCKGWDSITKPGWDSNNLTTGRPCIERTQGMSRLPWRLTCSTGVHDPGFGEFVLQLLNSQAGLRRFGRANRTNIFGFVTLVIDNLRMSVKEIQMQQKNYPFFLRSKTIYFFYVDDNWKVTIRIQRHRSPPHTSGGAAGTGFCTSLPTGSLRSEKSMLRKSRPSSRYRCVSRRSCHIWTDG